DDNGHALAHARLQAALPQQGVAAGSTPEQVAEEHGAVALDVRRLEARVEAPAKGVVAGREADSRAVEVYGGKVEFDAAGIAHHVAGAELAFDESEGHGQLHLAAAAEGVGNVLLLRRWVKGEYVDRPAAADVVVERLPRLR